MKYLAFQTAFVRVIRLSNLIQHFLSKEHAQKYATKKEEKMQPRIRKPATIAYFFDAVQTFKGRGLSPTQPPPFHSPKTATRELPVNCYMLHLEGGQTERERERKRERSCQSENEQENEKIWLRWPCSFVGGRGALKGGGVALPFALLFAVAVAGGAALRHNCVSVSVPAPIAVSVSVSVSVSAFAFVCGSRCYRSFSL